MDELLIASRIVHFAATASVAGGVLFRCLISDPALRRAAADPQVLRSALRSLLWIGLVLAFLSGAAWLLAVAANLGGEVGRVLADTRFGNAWLVRLGLAVLLAFSFGHSGLSAVLAAGLLGSLVWSGHAGAAPGATGHLHLAVDVLHLLAAGAHGSADCRRSGCCCAGRPGSRRSLPLSASRPWGRGRWGFCW